MRLRPFAVIIVSVLTSSIIPLNIANATPKASLTLTQKGENVIATWKYKGTAPSSQKLSIVEVISSDLTKPTVSPATSPSPTPSVSPTTSASPTPSASQTATESNSTVPLDNAPRILKLTKKSRSISVSDLVVGKKYVFTLTSTKPSTKTTRSIITVAKPSTPTNLYTLWSDKDVVIVWRYEGAVVKDWSVRYAGSDGSPAKTVKTGSSFNSARLKGLSKKLGYTFSVSGINAAGTGSRASDTISPVAPNEATAITVTPSNLTGTEVDVSWAYDGPAVSSFKVQIKSTGRARDLEIVTVDERARKASVDKLSLGATYTFDVIASSTHGSARASSSEYFVTKPILAPGNIIATPGNGSVALRWDPPISDTTNPIIGYKVEISADAGLSWRTLPSTGVGTTLTASGLTNGSPYNFRISALASKSVGFTSGAISSLAGLVPGSVVGLRVLPGAKSLTVDWSAPSTGVASSYKVEYKKSSETLWTALTPVTLLTSTISNLESGVTYNVRVTGVNDIGSGSPSVAVNGVPNGEPGAPSLTVTSSTTLLKLDLKWNAPASTGGSPITGYKVEQQIGNGSFSAICSSIASSATSCSVENLTPSVIYGYRVAAINSVGIGPWSPINSITVSAPPSAPVLSVVAGNSQAVLTWTAPANNGASITSYKIEVSSGSSGTWSTLSSSTTALTYTASSLSNGALYNFRVSAQNSAGYGAPSTVVSATPVTVPPVIVGVTAVAGVGEVNVSWTAPTNTSPTNGGSTLTGIVVSYRAAGGSWVVAPGGSLPATANSLSVTGLTGGLPYDFKVVSVNVVGSGADSLVKSATPYSLPPAPFEPSAVGKDGVVTLAWRAPLEAIPSGAGGSYKYQIMVYSSGETPITTISGVTGVSANITNLINGTTYQFRIAAGYTVADKVTYGDYVQISATPRGAPDAPTSLVATQLSDTTASFSWTPPINNGGSAITLYEIDKCSSCSVFTPTFPLNTASPTITLTGLTGGVGLGNLYTLYLRTVTALGTSGSVTVELSMLSLIAVNDLQGVATDSTMALTWGAPDASGTTYTISYKTSESAQWLIAASGVSAKMYTVTALTTATAYDFKVEAVNAAGTGSAATLTLSTL